MFNLANFGKNKRILIAAAVAIIGILVAYNAFYTPNPDKTVVVNSDNTDELDENAEFEEIEDTEGTDASNSSASNKSTKQKSNTQKGKNNSRPKSSNRAKQQKSQNKSPKNSKSTYAANNKTKKSPNKMPKNGNKNINTNEKININTATEKELQKINGIGPSKAKKIIEYRKEHGNFTKIEDIMKVKGIGDKIYEKIKSRIVI